ncbi:MAG: valine--tRNA ligase [Deltaproteobacteria bacterium]|nr:MAG: valine--tRNA ligase [Deltaproteobacteria bacterium]
MSSDVLAKGYEPQAVESTWYEYWTREGLFKAPEAEDRSGYAIVIPPPNVTGVLHMGHALNITLQDILCRYRRLRGDDVLWMPGTDHAGIATQNVVEKQLAANGASRHDIGRDQFIEAVWEWKESSGNAIVNQLKRLGASCDWDRERFTMDAGLSKAVRTVFVQLYNEGLIYRANYITNWCPRCQTALADLEVEHEETDGRLYHIKYPFSDGSGAFVVATTRPETLFGDTAVAVNPNDERYATITAKTVRLPLTNREIPIIRDDYVDMSFGTGALKVTPAHDPNDFHIGQRHHLDALKVIDDEGIMLEAAGRFQGMDRFDCRKAAVSALEAEGLLEKIEPHAHSVGHCYRCKTVVEPNLSLQWFVKVEPLAKAAIEAVEKGKTKIIPENWSKTYFEWMYNIRDWCISRQIWWGHQIPAWTCEDCGELIVEIDAPEKCRNCASTGLTRESDVLDTWFSSALWPFSTMGWPDKTPLLAKYYPTATLVTAFDILFFWVARMMMMGIHFMDEIPFQDVYIHALVRDENGQKMSKSKGNVIDPLGIMDTYGTDAFRFTLTAFAAQGRDIRLAESRIQGYRHFINKLWNSARFALMHLSEETGDIDTANLSLADRWILSRLQVAAETSAQAIDTYRFNEAAASLYHFVWHEFCDWYLEAIKPALYDHEGESRKQASVAVLKRVLSDTLILLHPIIPFVTEEIWSKLPGTDASIMKGVHPLDSAATRPGRNEHAEADMEAVMAIITAIRNIRAEMNIPPSLKLDVRVQSEDIRTVDTLNGYATIIENLARTEHLVVEAPGERPRSAATAVAGNASVFVSMEGVIDFQKETDRLNREIAKVEKEMVGTAKKLNNEDFLSKAPADVIDKVKEKQAQLEEKQEKLRTNLEKILELTR